MAVADWSTTAASNATTLGINIAEGCDAANMNNHSRELMAQAKAKFDALDASIASLVGVSSQPLDSDLTAIAALTTTSYGRGLLTLADVAALLALIITASSLTATGYIKLANGLFLMWGSKAYGSGATTITYNTELGITTGIATFSRAIISGGSASDNQANGPYVSACSTTGFTVNVTAGTGSTLFWIAVGA